MNTIIKKRNKSLKYKIIMFPNIRIYFSSSLHLVHLDNAVNLSHKPEASKKASSTFKVECHKKKQFTQ